MTSLPILAEAAGLHEAQWWEREADGRIHCYLCPRHCHIGEGQGGFCFIRVNRGGKLYSLGYGAPAALQVDPIEKKTAESFSAGHACVQHGNRRLQHGLFLLPELGHFEIEAGSGECA